jgi:SAM-dependent methyltransferase
VSFEIMTLNDINPNDRRPGGARFAFGENWADYSELIDPHRIEDAERALTRLAGPDRIAGRRMIDIGCGSGLHSLAALRLGASELVAIDFDADSVATTRKVLSRHAPEGRWRAEQANVLTLEPRDFGSFDLVYSWGVLHHTGDMTTAIERAAALVAPDGLFIFALYRKTTLCPFWKVEKRWYCQASPRAQKAARQLYIKWMRLVFRLKHRDFDAYVRSYGARGMEFLHDVHDWLGGYPYDSIAPSEVDSVMRRLGLEFVRSFLEPARSGVTGSGCDEFVYRRSG